MCSKQARKWNGCSALEVALIDPSFPGDDITTIVTFDLRIITFCFRPLFQLLSIG